MGISFSSLSNFNAYKKLEEIKIKEKLKIKELEEESQCLADDCLNTILYKSYGSYDGQWCLCKDCYDTLLPEIKVNFKINQK